MATKNSSSFAKQSIQKKTAKTKLSYRLAGVDRDLADQLVVSTIRPLAQKTGSPKGLKLSSKGRQQKGKPCGNLGGYASLVQFGKKNWVAISTDGVGTKLKLAFEADQHHTVGIDLVAMSVNDLLCVGALPTAFLDYLAIGKLDPRIAGKVIAGVAEGCRQAECSLVGGETAEMPGFYPVGQYDLAGFAMGGVLHGEAGLLPKKKFPKKVTLIGLPSSGFHSNGYSLIRKYLDITPASKTKKWREAFLAPTQIYVSAIRPLLDKKLLLGLSHITGSGLLNIPRISGDASYEITLPAFREIAPVIAYGFENFGLDEAEFASTFNCGVGMVLAVESKKVNAVLKSLKRSKQVFFELGSMKAPAKPEDKSRVVVHFPNGKTVSLKG